MRRLIVFLFILALAASSLAAGTWTAQTTGTTQNINSVHFINSLTGIAVGSSGTILKTTNGGSTWTPITVSFPDAASNYTFNAVHFPSSTVGYIAGSHNTIGGITATVYKTTDGGATWNPVAGTPSPNRAMNDVFFVTDTLGYICGNSSGDTNVSKTTDGGSTWATKAGGLEIGATFHGLNFLTATQGFVVSSAGIDYTSNGGDNWTSKNPWGENGGPPTMYDVYFVNTLNGWAVGNISPTYATVIKYNPDTDSFNDQTSPATNKLVAVHFINEYFGYTAGDAGTLVTTVNGGATWIAATPLNSVNLTDVFFTDAFHGWITGANGKIYAFNCTPTVSPTGAVPGWTGTLTITGDNFHPSITATGCAFSGGGITINTLTRNSATQLTVNITVSSTASVSSRDLTITDPGPGTASIIAAGAFSVNPPPTVTDWSRPDKRTANWVTQGFSDFIEVNGTNFQSGAAVVFSGTGIATVPAQTEYTPNRIKVKVYVDPTATTTFRDITVTNPDTGTGTLAGTFDIRPDTVGPAWSDLKLIYSPEHDYVANMAIPLPTTIFKTTLEDNTQIKAASLNFKIQLWKGITATQLVPDLEYSFTEGHYTYIEDPSNPYTKATVQCAIPSSLQTELATAGYFYIRFYGTDVEGNSRVSSLYQFQVQGGGPAPVTGGGYVSGLPSPNHDPSPTNPMTFQLDSNGYTGPAVIRIVGAGGGPSANITANLVAGATNNVTYDGSNSIGERLANGIYSALITDAAGNVIGKFRFVIFH